MSITDDILSNEMPSRQMAEYADQLRDWLGQAYQWQCMPYVMSCAIVNNQYSHSASATTHIRSVPNVNTDTNQTPQPENVPNQVPAGNNSERQQTPQTGKTGRLGESRPLYFHCSYLFRKSI